MSYLNAEVIYLNVGIFYVNAKEKSLQLAISSQQKVILKLVHELLIFLHILLQIHFFEHYPGIIEVVLTGEAIE